MGIGNMVYDKESDVLGIESSGAGYYSCSNSCSHINIPDTSQVIQYNCAILRQNCYKWLLNSIT